MLLQVLRALQAPGVPCTLVVLIRSVVSPGCCINDAVGVWFDALLNYNGFCSPFPNFGFLFGGLGIRFISASCVDFQLPAESTATTTQLCVFLGQVKHASSNLLPFLCANIFGHPRKNVDFPTKSASVTMQVRSPIATMMSSPWGSHLPNRVRWHENLFQRCCPMASGCGKKQSSEFLIFQPKLEKAIHQHKNFEG